uniref:Methyltransferase n=1 Tax=Rhizophora mucronata TaxID=61149 RepID=A0A2P2LHQ1_RHIMU
MKWQEVSKSEEKMMTEKLTFHLQLIPPQPSRGNLEPLHFPLGQVPSILSP